MPVRARVAKPIRKFIAIKDTQLLQIDSVAKKLGQKLTQGMLIEF